MDTKNKNQDAREARTKKPRCQDPKKKYKEAKYQIRNTKFKNSKGLRISETL